ncbi:MAG: CRISPR-associated endonuclease Cas3'' [Verrucomicrobia bacterium]|nr:CRISPR-associated endonuclease Cas3'' [Verrucomicrobiota bacterium]
MSFDDFFKAARNSSESPFDYQCRLACGQRRPNETEDQWLSHHTACDSRIIHVPTGLGKTAAVVLAWLWNRVTPALNPQSSNLCHPWPRRLVYCLPMRSLVEQTRDNVATWLKFLAKAWSKSADLQWLAAHSPVILMGGEDTGRDWDIHPERPAILIGTQDMLLSRALNRGYGMSRYRWPMHFGLLNNDCLWVMDETQLVGVGLETSAQLDAFRHDATMPAVGLCPTWWMSATLDDARLATVDHARPANGWPCVTLNDDDLNLPSVKERFEARKPLVRASVALATDTKKTYASQLARFIVAQHQRNSLTLVVVNRVDRAQETHEQLQKLQPTAATALMHSRFRPHDRKRHEVVLHETGSRIVIATQAVEAGVDVSARTLITELAPWPALVQRFGRCNRRGEFKGDEARLFWIDLRPKDDADDLALPYTAHDLNDARSVLQSLHDAGPATLRKVAPPPEPPVVRPVLRRKDLIELFDTTPDLAGHDLDISRFIRDGDDTDAQVFWRDCGPNPNHPLQPEPVAAELCRVSVPAFHSFLEKLRNARETVAAEVLRTAWVWNPLEERWEQAHGVRPGTLYMLDARAGGYSAERGWLGPAGLHTPVAPLAPSKTSGDGGYAGDPATFARAWITLSDHTRAVVDEADRMACELAPDCSAAFLTAARWHDVGKAHRVFQNAIRRGPHQPDVPDALYAKSKNRPSGYAPPEHARFFRHELASALAWLQTAPPDAPERDLVAYLIAAHHGKVRLSLRSLPGEEPPPNRPDARLARGVLEGDPLGPIEMEGVVFPGITLDLSLMEMGWDAEREAQRGPSWLARMIALRARFGPFRLAFLETLLRAADARASAAPRAGNQLSCAGVSGSMELREDTTACQTPSALSPTEQALVADLVADGLSIQDKFRPEPLYKQTGKGHYESKTVEDISHAKKRKGNQP